MRVVLDTNVVVSSLLKAESPAARVIALAETGTFDLLLSRPIRREYLEVLKHPKIQALHKRSNEQIENLVRRLFTSALLVIPTVALQVVEADPKYDKFIERAVSGGADVIVSGDKHLLRLGSYDGIHIVPPAIFMALLEREQAGTGR